jgi:superfamily II DNA/RNA helicase
MAPTRELVQQIEVECVKFDAAAGAGSVCIFGGVPKGPQEAALKRKPQIVIATPGRMVDLMDGGAAVVSAVRYLVLDEVRATPAHAALVP